MTSNRLPRTPAVSREQDARPPTLQFYGRSPLASRSAARADVYNIEISDDDDDDDDIQAMTLPQLRSQRMQKKTFVADQTELDRNKYKAELQDAGFYEEGMTLSEMKELSLALSMSMEAEKKENSYKMLVEDQAHYLEQQGLDHTSPIPKTEFPSKRFAHSRTRQPSDGSSGRASCQSGQESAAGCQTPDLFPCSDTGATQEERRATGADDAAVEGDVVIDDDDYDDDDDNDVGVECTAGLRAEEGPRTNGLRKLYSGSPGWERDGTFAVDEEGDGARGTLLSPPIVSSADERFRLDRDVIVSASLANKQRMAKMIIDCQSFKNNTPWKPINVGPCVPGSLIYRKKGRSVVQDPPELSGKMVTLQGSKTTSAQGRITRRTRAWHDSDGDPAPPVAPSHRMMTRRQVNIFDESDETLPDLVVPAADDNDGRRGDGDALRVVRNRNPAGKTIGGGGAAAPNPRPESDLPARRRLRPLVPARPLGESWDEAPAARDMRRTYGSGRRLAGGQRPRLLASSSAPTVGRRGDPAATSTTAAAAFDWSSDDDDDDRDGNADGGENESDVAQRMDSKCGGDGGATAAPLAVGKAHGAAGEMDEQRGTSKQPSARSAQVTGERVPRQRVRVAARAKPPEGTTVATRRPKTAEVVENRRPEVKADDGGGKRKAESNTINKGEKRRLESKAADGVRKRKPESNAVDGGEKRRPESKTADGGEKRNLESNAADGGGERKPESKSANGIRKRKLESNAVDWGEKRRPETTRVTRMTAKCVDVAKVAEPTAEQRQRHEDDDDDDDMTQIHPRALAGGSVATAMQPPEPGVMRRVHVRCPLCALHYRDDVIELHAAECTGERSCTKEELDSTCVAKATRGSGDRKKLRFNVTDVVQILTTTDGSGSDDDIRYSDNVDDISCWSRRRRLEQRHLPMSPQDSSPSERCYLCQKMIPFKAYPRHVSRCIVAREGAPPASTPARTVEDSDIHDDDDDDDDVKCKRMQ
ncbi:PREDICTED: uncharacterized protein LOC106813763 [Priapulus caudatus]|uniref:Uncharacterized protein LOC106813763 n=1 Tax=Priapulus caudatus TaxID=37621 RepID=A0ABM1EMP9_PRICU|nr:PREDICTED: uncharacterized protein LOC106813763 [Priapulus caudatus]